MRGVSKRAPSIFSPEHVARRRESGLVLSGSLCPGSPAHPSPSQSSPDQSSPVLPCTSSHPVA
ncbi:hypothetical protein E2C01_061477 [Portunus trituberculatus]|uniref:Uncharacterized protein n=1 Tax=Portunus trituberculatus TaxID=210409 RepID=A0A5B7HF50_PORTR|nr:hypothetical protein [Portunus trituberculatus]